MALIVTDNGQGIPPEIKDRIFDPCFTTEAVGKGSGLGLSIVHGIVENFNGDISVESEPGKGTSVIVRFPVCDRIPELEKIKALRPDLPVIVCTGYSEKLSPENAGGSPENAGVRGVDAVLMKPFEVATASRLIRQVLET